MKMMQYVQVAEDENEEPIELPTEEDSTLLLSTLAAQFPGSCGMKYRNPETGGMRGIRLADGRLHAPDNASWGSVLYYCVFPKAARNQDQEKDWVKLENKRKGDDALDNPTAKTKRVEKRKCSDLIVLGLPWRSTEEDIKKYFEQFGDVIMVQIKRDINTKQSKGYGFIRFSEYESQISCLKQRHLIDGRWCEVRIPNSKVDADSAPRKVFVGRTTEDMQADDLRAYFSKHGEVIDVFIPKPFRAFAFVTFADPDVAQSLLGEDHIIKGVSVHVSQAAPKNYEKSDMRKGQDSSGFKGSWGPGNRSNQLSNSTSMGGNMGANNPMNMNMAPFQLNQAMVAAASAALGQAGWNLFGLAGQSGGSNCNNEGGVPAGSGSSSSSNQGGFPVNQTGSGGSGSGGNFLGWGSGGPGGDNSVGGPGGGGWSQNKGGSWN